MLKQFSTSKAFSVAAVSFGSRNVLLRVASECEDDRLLSYQIYVPVGWCSWAGNFRRPTLVLEYDERALAGEELPVFLQFARKVFFAFFQTLEFLLLP